MLETRQRNSQAYGIFLRITHFLSQKVLQMASQMYCEQAFVHVSFAFYCALALIIIPYFPNIILILNVLNLPKITWFLEE